jgi:hypothetical protein
MGRRTHFETAIGWTLAVACHPFIGWQVLSKRRRWLIPLGYFGASYIGILVALFAA